LSGEIRTVGCSRIVHQRNSHAPGRSWQNQQAGTWKPHPGALHPR
jgi:hypothetical protein